jgi:minor extracellular serine protease Vpr
LQPVTAGQVTEKNIGVAPQADLIVVKIGTTGVRSFARTTELMRAVKYVIEKARILRQPIAINISFGMNNGSHMGDSIFETYLSDISTVWKNSIVIPTGNEGTAGHHYEGQIASAQIKEIEFFTASGIEQFYLSLWKNFADNFAVELVFPEGATSGVINIESQVKNVRINNLELTVIYGQPSHYSVRQEIYLNIRAITGTINTGLWKLKITAMNIVDGNFEIWLPTLEEVTAKTYFSTPTEVGTLTIPSTSQKAIKVSGYNDRIGNIAEFSGRGYLNSALPNPDLAAPAVGILTTRSGGGYDSYTGTSFAAPFVTGSAALMMQWGIVEQKDPFLYGERLKAFLRLGANRKAATNYPNNTFGYGTLCLNNTINFLERYLWGEFYIWLI